MISKKPLFSWVFERHRGLQLLLVALIVATIFFRVFPLEMQKRIINQAIALKKVNLLLVYCVLYISAVMLAGVLKYVINVLQGYIGQKILLDMRARLYEHILTLPLSFFRRTPPGTVIASLLSELGTVGEFLGGAIAIPLINVLTLVTFAGYLAYLNPMLAAISFAIYPIEIFIIPTLQKRYNRLNLTRIEITRSLSNFISEAISGIHEIHGNASYQLEKQKLNNSASTLFNLRHRMNIIRYLIKFANNFFQSLGPFTLFLLGGYFTIQGKLDLGALVAFLSAYEKLYDPWKELMDYYQEFQDSRVRYRQIMDYFDVTPEFELEPRDDREVYKLLGKIDVKDLSLDIDSQTRILNQISLALQPGEQLALVGLSGSGKSTLAMVLGQLYSYTGGHLLVDGKELKSLTKFDTSHNIGYVAQYPFIFDGSILENVLYSCNSLQLHGPDNAPPLPSREEVLDAVDQVGLSEDILRMGLNALLKRDRQGLLVKRLIDVRSTFYRKWRDELSETVEFFDLRHIQHHTTLGENITFGPPNREEYELPRLSRNALFVIFLREVDLMGPLERFGEEIAYQTVRLLERLDLDEFFFQLSPIPMNEFERYKAIVDTMNKAGRGHLMREDKEALLRVALNFIPAKHKMADLPPSLEALIIDVRHRFMEKINKEDPGAFTFYEPTEYLFTHGVLENIIFGHVKTDYPQALEDIRRKVEELIKEKGLIQEVLEAGLDFQVGSKGDRLSGGQKQKIALARALLKSPTILILDEATASLDNASQARVQQLLSSALKGKCTLISVAHRLELIKDYSLIAVMKAGEIVEIGPYKELMARKGPFYELAHGS